MTEYIQAKSLRERFRDHPTMYIGRGHDLQGLLLLIRELLKDSVRDEAQNNCSRLEVALKSDNSIVVIDNGRGLPLGPFDYGQSQPSLEKLFTMNLLFNHPNAEI